MLLRQELGGDLRTVTIGRLLEAQLRVAAKTAEPGSLEPPFQLVADDDLVAEDLVEAAPAGPALISWTKDELRALVPDAPQDVVEAANGFSVSDRLAAKLDAFVYRFDWEAPGNPGLEAETGLRDVWAAFLHGKRPSATWAAIRPMRP
ncbi:hypothetical protein ABZ342_22865 [Amycolatopsis sp. NPDC005961]|uniref:hypothetical protein n=1 Tax=Amycolatopsis sp. NPDC005961 TaxID=3156720 RepID=UPI0033EDB0F1